MRRCAEVEDAFGTIEYANQGWSNAASPHPSSNCRVPSMSTCSIAHIADQPLHSTYFFLLRKKYVKKSSFHLMIHFPREDAEQLPSYLKLIMTSTIFQSFPQQGRVYWGQWISTLVHCGIGRVPQEAWLLAHQMVEGVVGKLHWQPLPISSQAWANDFWDKLLNHRIFAFHSYLPQATSCCMLMPIATF